jgi:acetamidase/formamidase
LRNSALIFSRSRGNSTGSVSKSSRRVFFDAPVGSPMYLSVSGRPEQAKARTSKMQTHRLDAGPETVHWGFFDAALKPLITVDPGDTVVVSTVSGAPTQLPPADSGLSVPAALTAIHKSVPQRLNGPHIMTGPVAVRGAKAGQVLEVRIKSVELNYDWGYNAIRPLAGALPDDFEKARLIHIPLDRTRMVGKLPWGLELPLKPFFGIMAVAPPTAWGPVASPPPRRNGGNIDNKELVAGTTLYLPIHVDGALFSVGDGHGVQGDGEVCITAIETGLIGTFELHVRADMALEWPLAETPTHVITMAFDPDLDDAVVIALRDMIKLICARTGISREDAYTLCSLAADLRVTQVVNGAKGIHIMLEKAHLRHPIAARR